MGTKSRLNEPGTFNNRPNRPFAR